MTDEMLDRLKSLADKIVLRDGDVEIAVVSLLLAENDRLRGQLYLAGQSAQDLTNALEKARTRIKNLESSINALSTFFMDYITR